MRRIEKPLRMIEAVGADRLLRPWLAGRGAIYVLHRVAETGSPVLDPDMAVESAFLNNALKLTLSQGWLPVAIHQAPELLQGRSKPRCAVFTFDDGYRDNATLALPVFQSLGVPFCVYVATGLIDRTANYWWGCLARLIASSDRIDTAALGLPGVQVLDSWPRKQDVFAALEAWVHRELEARAAQVLQWCRGMGIDDRAAMDEDFLSWSEIRELSRDPLVTIGAHGVSHCRLATLEPSALRAELVECRQRIEAEIGRPVRHLAYPYGGRAACGEREFRLAAEAGYTTAVTTRRGTLFAAHASRMTALPRQRLTEGLPDLRTVRRGLNGTHWFLHRGPRIVLD